MHPLSLLLPLLPLLSPASSLTPPPTTYPNGTAQPFYPCGYTAAQVRACPYRCLSATGTLSPTCYNARDAAAQISAGQNCVSCVAPTTPADYPGGCTPLDPTSYFTTTAYRPAPCGQAGGGSLSSSAANNNCRYICGEAQVPFSVCSATNDTGAFELCEPCVPTCSSPRVVFAPPGLPRNFSLSVGSCSAQYGTPELRWCPFRCATAGDPNRFCAAGDQSDGVFTTCTACT